MTRQAVTAIVVIAWLFAATHAQAQSDFFQGTTIRIIVGYSPGGGYDALARMLSRQMPKHIPGHPTILVENMAGAGSLLAANHIFKVAKPDGLTIGHFSGGFVYSQVMGQPGIDPDMQKFVFVGASPAARHTGRSRANPAEGIAGDRERSEFIARRTKPRSDSPR